MSAQKPPSHITELENLVSNLRRDLQVAHDALHKAHKFIEDCAVSNMARVACREYMQKHGKEFKCES